MRAWAANSASPRDCAQSVGSSLHRRLSPMIPGSRWMKDARHIGAAAIVAVILCRAGCQPEGVGTVKPPGPAGPRGSDDRLGRPFGNAPELPKKAAPAPTPPVEPANPRL